MSSESEYYSNLVEVMLKTRGIRFSVAESEKVKEKFSVATVALLSIYLASWSFAMGLFPECFNELQIKALSFISIVASISLLVISLFDYAADRSVFSEKMLQNAFSITKISRESERELARSDPDFKKLSDLAAEYEGIVSGAGINHNSKDYRLWLLRREKPSGVWQAFKLWLKIRLVTTLSFTYAMAFQLMLLICISLSTVIALLFL